MSHVTTARPRRFGGALWLRVPAARLGGTGGWLAEGGGFEPPRVLPLNTDSSRAP